MILGSAFRFNCKAVKSWLKFLCASERCVKCWLHCWIISMEPVSFSGESPAICPCGSSPGLIRVYLLLEAYCLSCCMLGTNGEKALESLLFRLQIFHLILVLLITHIFCCHLCLLSSSSYSFILKNYLFLIDWCLLYNIGLISVIHQHELTIGIRISPPSWISLPPPAHSHPSRLLQSPSLSSLSHTANSHWLSVDKCWCTCIHAALHSCHPLPLVPHPGP